MVLGPKKKVENLGFLAFFGLAKAALQSIRKDHTPMTFQKTNDGSGMTIYMFLYQSRIVSGISLFLWVLLL